MKQVEVALQPEITKEMHLAWVAGAELAIHRPSPS